MSSLSAAKYLLILCTANFLIQVENKAIFGIGTRIIGDQLLLKDVLKTPPISLTEKPFIKFNYAIPQPITYIEIVSANNTYAMADFSYENDLVEGTIRTDIPQLISGLDQKPNAFEVLIQIYGLNDTFLNINPAHILNKDQQFNGILSPLNEARPYETLNLMKENAVALENTGEPLDEYDNENDDEEEDDDYEQDDFNESLNKIIELGARQEGDVLLYETYQTSLEETIVPINHTVVFYFIDNSFISHVRFTIFDHYLDNPYNPTDNLAYTYRPPSVAFEKISLHTLKAIVTDQHTTSLFVQMQVYGYQPNDKPVAFQSYLTSVQSVGSSNSNFPYDEDVVYVTVKVSMPAKRRIRVRFIGSNEVAVENEVKSNGAQAAGAAGHLVIFNLLSNLLTTWAVLLLSSFRHMFYYA